MGAQLKECFMKFLVWLFFAYCAYQAYIGVTTGVVLGFGGRGNGISMSVPYEEHPIGYFMYLGFYISISAGALLAIVRWIRNR